MKGVRRLLSFGLAWLAAAVAASVIAWQGVGLVGDQVTDTDQRPATLTADEIEAALAEPAGDDTSPPTTPPGTGDQAPQGPTTTTSGDQPAPETRTYRLGGGTAVLRFTPDGVTLEQAVPKLGFEVRYQPVEGNGWRVEFVGDEGRSRVEGWWDGGPRERIDDEFDEDGHDDVDDGGRDEDEDGEQGGAPVAGDGHRGDAA
jgi:hypothetical protein